MRVRYLMTGLGVLGACLIGLVALALAQPSGSYPPASPEPEAPGPSGTLGPPVVPGAQLVQPVDPGSTPAPGTMPGLGGQPVTPNSAEAPPGSGPGGVRSRDRDLPQPIKFSQGEDRVIDPGVMGEGPTGRQEPSVSMEWIGPPNAKVGQAADYSLVVRNTSNIPVQQVLVRVRIPQGMTIGVTEPKSIQENNVLMWELGTLMARQDKNLQMKLQANTKGDVMPQAWVTFTGSAVTRIRIREPKLTLKASTAKEVLVGDTASFTLTVSNPGDGSADRVKIETTLSAGLEAPKANSDGSSDRVRIFEIGNLAAGETRSVQLLCLAIGKNGGVESVDAVAKADGGLTAQDSVKTTVIMPRLDLTMHGPGLKYLDRKALYTLKVTNPGNAPATNVTVSDVVPEGFKVLAASDGGRHDYNIRTVSWFLGEIGAGQAKEVKFETQAIALGTFKHKARVSGARGLSAEAEFTTRVEGLSALLLEMVDTEDPIEVGGDTGYEFHVTNTGSQTETDIKLVATVPDKMEFKSAQGPVKYHPEGKLIIFDPIEKLAPKADGIFRIHVKALEPGTVRFKLQMTSTNLQEPVIKMEATRIYSDAAPDTSNTPTTPGVLPPN